MNYPFGEEVKRVVQKGKSRRKYFVLGVYASAVHAKWIGPDNKIKVKAFAVASEPEIFWKGNQKKAEQIISKIPIPSEIGRLEPAAPNFNGPSGIELDESYLKPLGLTRKDVWLCDLLPYSRLNEGQIKAIKREYEPIEKEFNLPKVTLEKVPSRFSDEERLEEIKEELKNSGADTIILLGNIPIKEFAGKFNPKYKKLSDFKAYGELHKIEIDDKIYQILPLAHPRQVGKLGKSNYKWFQLHQDWIKRKEKERSM